MSQTPASGHAEPGPATPADDGFNLSRWALAHQSLTRFLMVVLMLLGAGAYFQLG